MLSTATTSLHQRAPASETRVTNAIAMQYFHARSSVSLIAAVQGGDLSAVALSLADDPDGVGNCDDKGYTAFHWAAYIDDVRILDALNNARDGLWMEQITHKAQTILHIACSNSSIGSVRWVLEHLGSSTNCTDRSSYINVKNRHMETALHLSAGCNRGDIAQLLLEHGADPYIRDQWGRTPRKVALENGYIFTAAAIAEHYDTSYNRLLDEPEFAAPEQPVADLVLTALAAELKKKLSVHPVEVLDKTGGPENGIFGLAPTITVERQMFGSSSASKTAGAAEAVKPLKAKMALSKMIEFPGDPVRLTELLQDETVALNGKDMYGITALMKFAAWNKVELVKMLLPALSTEEVNVTGGKQKLPCLHYCVDMDAVEALRVLLADGRVDTSSVDEHGRTFREHAVHMGKRALLDELEVLR